MQTYTGGCHCGNVRFSVDMDLGKVMACNCSICAKRGWLLAFVPQAQFTLLQGEDALTNYQFNKKLVNHLFCKMCGTASFGRGSDGKGNEMVAINVRCLDDVDINTLEVTEFDGKSM